MPLDGCADALLEPFGNVLVVHRLQCVARPQSTLSEIPAHPVIRRIPYSDGTVARARGNQPTIWRESNGENPEVVTFERAGEMRACLCVLDTNSPVIRARCHEHPIRRENSGSDTSNVLHPGFPKRLPSFRTPDAKCVVRRTGDYASTVRCEGDRVYPARVIRLRSQQAVSRASIPDTNSHVVRA